MRLEECVRHNSDYMENRIKEFPEACNNSRDVMAVMYCNAQLFARTKEIADAEKRKNAIRETYEEVCRFMRYYHGLGKKTERIERFKRSCWEIEVDVTELCPCAGRKQKNKCLFSSVLLKMFVIYYRAASGLLFMRFVSAWPIYKSSNYTRNISPQATSPRPLPSWSKASRRQSISDIAKDWITGSGKTFTMVNIILEFTKVDACNQPQ